MLLTLPRRLLANLIRPHFLDTTLETEELGSVYENYSRTTTFFYGHIKKVEFNNYLFKTLKRTVTGIEYNILLGVGAVKIDGRKTDTPGGLTAHFGISKDIWGDLVVFPTWKWNIGISAGSFIFRKYLGKNIDMNYNFIAANIAISCSKRWDWFIPYAGVEFFLAYDEFLENITGVTQYSTTNGFTPFAGYRIQLSYRWFIQMQTNIINKTGYSGSLEIVF